MHTSRPSLFLAFDFGLKRVGVAFGNAITQTATPVAVVETPEEATRFKQIDALIKEWQPEGLVVGVPCHPDGSPNDLTERCQRFARQLEGRFGLPCSLVDERYTSAVAEACTGQGGRKAGRADKGRIDMGSACLILEQFFLEGR